MFRTHPVRQVVWCVHTLLVFKCVIIWLIRSFYNILENSHILSTCNLLLAVKCTEAYEIHRYNPFDYKWPSLVCTPWQWHCHDTCWNEVTVMSCIVSAGTVNENVKLQVVFLIWSLPYKTTYISRTRTAVFGTFQEPFVVAGGRGRSVLISILQQFLILSISKIMEVSCATHIASVWKCLCTVTKNSSINGQDTDSCMCTVDLTVLTVV
jgi:hypothetical protein